MARLSLTLIILGIGFISSTLSDDVTLSPTTETAEAAAVGSSGSSILESTSVSSQERDDPPKGMDVWCYVCNSLVDGDDCGSSDATKLAPYKVQCNNLTDGYLSKVYGIKDGKEIDFAAKDGTWFKDSDEAKPSETAGDSLTIKYFKVRAKDGETYDICRRISIQAPETVNKKQSEDDKKSKKKKDSQAAINADNPRIIRTCGVLSKGNDEDGKCKDFKAKGGSTTTCVCKGGTKEKPCNGSPRLAIASKMIMSLLGVVLIVFV